MTAVSMTFDASTLQRIYPYVVSRAWVDHVGADHVVSVPFTDEVHMVLVVDDHGSVHNVQPEDLHAVRTSPEEALEIAGHNLGMAWQAGEFSIGTAELLDDTLVGGVRGSWMAPAGGLVLRNLYDTLVDMFDQDEFVAVAVNQQFLVAFPTDEATLASASLRQMIDDEFTGDVKPISRSWLLLDGDWPRAYPGPAAF